MRLILPVASRSFIKPCCGGASFTCPSSRSAPTSSSHALNAMIQMVTPNSIVAFAHNGILHRLRCTILFSFPC